MVKLAGPMMSMAASGSLGGVITFATWKGRPYARSLVKPANPKSAGQVGVRAMFKFLSQHWAGLSDGEKATWQARADDGKYSPFNAFMAYNQSRWRDFNAPSEEDPAAEAATAPDACTGVATPDVRSMSIAITHGTNAPDGGIMLFRSLTTSFAPAFSNCIAVLEVDGNGDATYVDTPLTADQYFYMANGFMVDGQEGADGTEFDGTVT